jgi:hypothetical protein
LKAEVRELMFKTQRNLEHLIPDRRAIGNLAAAIIALAIIGSVLIGVALIIWFWPAQTFSPWPIVNGSGNLVTEEQHLSDFTIADIGYAFDVEIIQANSYSINITVDDNLLDYVEVFKTGNTLTIRLKSGYSYHSATKRAVIMMPELYELRLSGATHGTVVGFDSTNELALDISGASSLNGDFLTSENAQITVSGASSVEINGTAADLQISVSGASHLDLSDFPVHDVDVDISGASHATVNLDGRLAGHVSGASHLKYLGNPTSTDGVSTSGGSTVGPQ